MSGALIVAKEVLLGEPIVANEFYRLGDMAYESPRLAFLSFLIFVGVWSAMTFHLFLSTVRPRLQPPVQPPAPPPVQPPAPPPVPPPVAQPAVVRPPGQGPEVREHGCQTPVHEMMVIDFVREQMIKMGLNVKGCKEDLLKRGFEHVKVMNDMV